MIRFLLQARYVSLAVVLTLLVVLLAFGRHVTYEQSIEAFFPEDDPDVMAYREASTSFGNDNVIFILYDDPNLLTPSGMTRLRSLASAVQPETIDAVTGVQALDAMPLFWRIDEELVRVANLPLFLRGPAVRVAEQLVANLDPSRSAMSVGGALRESADDPAALAALREKITAHPLLQGTVVNAEGTSTAVVVRLKGMAEQDVKRTVADLRAAADRFATKNHLSRPALVGPPVLLADGFSAIERDGHRLAIVGMALIGLVTLTATRSLWWAIVPILAGWTVWLATETILATLGLKLSLSGGPLVAQIIVLTMPAASHLAIHFRDDLRTEKDRSQAARSTLRAVSTPILWCAVTGTLGYGALLSSNVVPIRQFGSILAVCTLVAAILTMVISPVAMRPPFRLEIPVRHGSTSRLSTRLNRLIAHVERHPAPIVLGVLIVVFPLALGMIHLRFESNYINAFKSDTRVVQDYHKVETRLGGIGLISLVVPLGESLDMGTLNRFRTLDRRVSALDEDRTTGPVSRVISLATVLDPDGVLSELPEDKAAFALQTKLRLISASPQADLLHGFWSPDGHVSRILVRLPEQQPAQSKEATFVKALSQARLIFGPESYLTGMSYLLTQTTRGVMATSWITFLWAVGSILLMLILAFRGPLLAALAIVPSLLAVGLVLGLMGWLDVKLDIATALVASVALGLSVDDTFHCLLQYRRHRKDKSFRESLFASYAITGPGVLLSSLAVAIGFGVLRFSEFVPFSNFGTMVGIATLGSSLGNLVLLPACLALGHRLRSTEDVPSSSAAVEVGMEDATGPGA